MDDQTRMKCAVCDEPAASRFSPDLDIQGVGTCHTHFDQVQLAYMFLLNGHEDMFYEQIGKKKPKEKK